MRLFDEMSGCAIWLKLEYTLPSGSTKDRVASWMLTHAIDCGSLRSDSLVVEASSGSTSISLAMASAILGVRFRAVMPETVSRERVLMIRAFGGEVQLTAPSEGLAGAIAATEALAAQNSRVVLTRQFQNPLNSLAHEHTTGPELLRAVNGPIHGFVAGVGTGGTFMGVGRFLRAAGQQASLRRAQPTVGLPSDEPEICGGIPGVIDGMSLLLDEAAIGADEPIVVSHAESFQAARQLIASGLPVGPSSGLNFAAALRMAALLGPRHNIATVLCDRMERYFSTNLFDHLSSP